MTGVEGTHHKLQQILVPKKIPSRQLHKCRNVFPNVFKGNMKKTERYFQTHCINPLLIYVLLFITCRTHLYMLLFPSVRPSVRPSRTVSQELYIM